MTFDTAKEILERITYKPGWKLELTFQSYPESATIEIDYSGPDSLEPTGTTKVHFDQSVHLSYFEREDRFTRFVFACIQSAERHEMEEWFKLDGQCVFDAHPKHSLK